MGGVRERFACGAGPAGWRYVGSRDDGTRLELVLARSRVLRLEVASAGWLLRGGVVGAEVLWRRGEEERCAPAHGFTGDSPAYALAVARLGPGRRRLVSVHGPALATLLVDQQWTLASTAVTDGRRVDSWHVDDLATGQRTVWRLAGEVVLGGPDVALADLV